MKPTADPVPVPAVAPTASGKTNRLISAQTASQCDECNGVIRHDEDIVLPGGSRTGWHRACANKLGLEYEDRRPADEPHAPKQF